MQQINQVMMTTDYSMFKNIDGNRNINKLHLSRLKKSINEKYISVPIIVNGRYEIIDGQHRFQSAVDLNKPVYFMKIDDLKLPDIHRLNTNLKNWNGDDYLEGYCQLGYKDYIRYREFKETYKFGHHETRALLSGRLESNSNLIEDFKNGSFKIKDIRLAEKNAEKIIMLGEFYEGIRRRTFVKAMLELFRNPEYNHSEFIRKLSFQRESLVDCTSSKQYITLIEEIYNYKRVNKVNLRF